jgi:signal transduction histidine kinase
MSAAGQDKSDRAESSILLIQEHSNSEIATILDREGYAVSRSADGLKAFEKIAEKTPDLIVIDLPSGDVAIETCRRLKENMAARDIPIMMACDLGKRGEVADLLKAGASDILFKPVAPEEVTARVRLNTDLSKARRELARLEHRFRETRAEKNEFLSIVAHDLRSPLSNIVTSSDILSQDVEMPREQLAEFLQIISASGKHMIHLVENLMDLNAIEQGRMNLQIAPCEVGEIVRGVAANHDSRAKAKQQELAFHEESGPLVAMADPNSTIQIFDNLLSNAIKYSPMGKRIDIRLRPDNGKIRCEVQDQGPGLTKEDLQKMFGKFAKLSAQPTAGEPSTGLGLSIVKKMVEAIGGNVWCESELGKGSTFVVELQSAALA